MRRVRAIVDSRELSSLEHKLFKKSMFWSFHASPLINGNSFGFLLNHSKLQGQKLSLPAKTCLKFSQSILLLIFIYLYESR